MTPPADETRFPADSSPMSESEFVVRFRRSYRTFWLIARGVVHDHGLAEDVVQEAAMTALGKRAQFREGTNFQAWVGQFVRHIALNRARRERRSRSTTLDPTTLESRGAATDECSTSTAPTPGAEALIDARVCRALEDVGDVARTCLLLRTIEGLEYSKIADLLGIPEGTAMSHVHRTRKFLRERLMNDMGFMEGDRS